MNSIHSGTFMLPPVTNSADHLPVCAACKAFFACENSVHCKTCGADAAIESEQITCMIKGFELRFDTGFRRTDDYIFDETVIEVPENDTTPPSDMADTIIPEDNEYTLVGDEEIETYVESDGCISYASPTTNTDDYIMGLDNITPEECDRSLAALTSLSPAVRALTIPPAREESVMRIQDMVEQVLAEGGAL